MAVIQKELYISMEEYEARVQALEKMHNRLHTCSTEQEIWLAKLLVMEEQGQKLLAILQKSEDLRSNEDKLVLEVEASKDQVLTTQYQGVAAHNKVWDANWTDVCNAYLKVVTENTTTIEDCYCANYKPKDEDSYPTIRIGKSRATTHALSLRFHHTEDAMITKGDHRDGSHLCHNRLCFRITHVITEVRKYNLARIGCNFPQGKCDIPGCTLTFYCQHIPPCIVSVEVGHKRKLLAMET
jgi:hypothetical protein